MGNHRYGRDGLLYCISLEPANRSGLFHTVFLTWPNQEIRLQTEAALNVTDQKLLALLAFARCVENK